MTERFSTRCQYCGGRIVAVDGESRDDARHWHEQRCDLSVDCGYCDANAGQRCTTRDGKRSPTHQSRHFVAMDGPLAR